MTIPNRKFLFLNGILLAVLFAHSIYRDVIFDKQFPQDLRNRVVGSRLQKDGINPYNYVWQPADGIRYYDARNPNDPELGINSITASPFFHAVFNPLFEFPQRTVSEVWLCLQYILLIGMIGLFYLLTAVLWKRWLVVNFGILFTSTEAWKCLISSGQLYFVVAALMTGILFLLVKNKKWSLVTAGLLAICFVLIRPTGLVLFIPFLFFFRKYILFLSVAFAVLTIYGMYILTNPFEKALYLDYASCLEKQSAFHLQDDRELLRSQVLDNIPFDNIEGYDVKEVAYYLKKYPIRTYSENGNIFVLYHKLTKTRMSATLLGTLWAISMILVSVLFYYSNGKQTPAVIKIVLAGFLLYMISELLSPIHRPQYNTVQWFPLVLTGILLIRDCKTIVFFLLVLGLILNIINVEWLLVRHTLGEFAWLGALLLLIFTSHPDKKHKA
jgi:hypothetical protein